MKRKPTWMDCGFRCSAVPTDRLRLSSPEFLTFRVIQRTFARCEIAFREPHHIDAHRLVVKSPKVNRKTIAIGQNGIIREGKIQPGQFELVLSVSWLGRFLHRK